MSQDLNDDGYVLSRTPREYERLRVQAERWAPFTDQVLARAGLGSGMSVLDAGCGPGEVMRLMGRRVGQDGVVTGVDIDPEVGAYGLKRLQGEEACNFNFHTADLLSGETVPGAPFDMVFCRFLLIHMDDPIAMVRRLAALTRPGGVLVAMDYVIAAALVAPPDPVLVRGIEIMNLTLAAAGRSLDAGARLASWFREAGLPMPHGTDLHGKMVVTYPDLQLAEGVAGFGPKAVRLGVATEEEIAALPDRIRAVAARGEHCYHSPTVGAAWTWVGNPATA
ncbi:class I SAM-dependent methyltransferase [Primorskyibacter aestuariivivens]|uniref:class I SAM-dependent methyltransferase n=1 Tax=Primorskyibacter aestuariivivens TaxID=1888912 RepID=UPI00230168BA|nr:class I SAM-dependent methyltransferase [Primorskyibacter aestuariivivens]MDA7430433.1 class I SAM-dependent methyltransferase [Primorskyibacter aestuariivivens]